MRIGAFRSCATICVWHSTRVPISRVDSSSVVRILQKGLGYPARWRLDHDVYGLPIEVWINQRLKRFRLRSDETQRRCQELEPAAAANCP